MPIKGIYELEQTNPQVKNKVRNKNEIAVESRIQSQISSETHILFLSTTDIALVPPKNN